MEERGARRRIAPLLRDSRPPRRGRLLPQPHTLILQLRNEVVPPSHLAVTEPLPLGDLLKTQSERSHARDKLLKFALRLDAGDMPARGVSRSKEGVALGEGGSDRAGEGEKVGVL